MRKLKEILIGLFLLAYMILTYGFINKQENLQVCKKIDINITDQIENHFIEKKDILNMLTDRGADMIGEHFKKINRENLENIIHHHPTIKDVEIYFLNNGSLNIDISQRKPIVRVINSNEESYYIDQSGYLMPLSDNFSAYVLVANGNINEPYHDYFKKNVLATPDSTEKFSEKLANIYKLSKFIANDKLWSNQIEQIYFNKKGEIELAPRVGAQIIILGKMDNFKRKFKKLRAVYNNGFKKLGWNKYRIVNLKFKNQVVCTKK